MRYISYFFLLVLSFLSHWVWVSNLSFLTSGDWIYQDPQMLKEFFSLPSIWTTSGLGGVNLSLSFTPFQVVYSILSFLQSDYGLSERIVFLWPMLIVMPIGSYLLIKHLTKHTLAAVIGSFVYCYNTYFSELKTGHITLLTAYAFIPIMILFYKKTLETKKLSYVFLTVLFGFIVSFYEFRAFYITCFIILFYFLFYIFFIEKIKTFKSFFTVAFFGILPLVLVLCLNGYWLFALGTTGSLTENAFFDRSLFGNEFLNSLHALSFHHPFWTGAKSALFEVQAIPFLFWIIPFFAFMGLYVQRAKRNILFFGFIALFGIFLTKQVAPPFTEVYPWLFDHFPGFNAFREASKFYLLIALGYSVLLAGFVKWLWEQQAYKGSIVSFLKYFVTALLVFLFLWNVKPFVTGEFGTLFTPRQMPHDYLVFKQFILLQDRYSRTLWIPVSSRWSMYTNNHPAISGIVTMNAEWNTFIKEKRTDTISESELIRELLTLPEANNLFDQSAIRYVIVPLEDQANEDNFFVDYKKPRNYYSIALDALPYLHKKDIGTKEMMVYENYGARPHIYKTQDKEQLDKEIPYQQISFTPLNPSTYTLEISHIDKPFYLQFAENFHPQWKLRAGAFNWVDSLINKEYFLSDAQHTKSPANLNSFYLDPQMICRDFSCIKNSDGTYTIHLTLYFLSQSYIYAGLLISGGVFGVMLVWGLLLLRRKKYEKRKTN